MDVVVGPVTLIELLRDWHSGPGPMYARLAKSLERAVLSGDLQSLQRLPSERELARALAVSRGTVVRAYEELRSLGILESKTGSGTTVNRRRTARRAHIDGRVPDARAGALFQRLADGPSDVISLAYAVEPAIAELRDVLDVVIERDLESLLTDVGYYPAGLPSLRSAIAHHYTALKLITNAEQIVVTTGAAQAIGLIAQAYLRPGSTVIVESPSWPGCLDVFLAMGVRIIGIPMDDEGLRIDALATAVKAHQPDLLYVMPTYHNPAGTLMSAERRKQVARLAGTHGITVVEDNAYVAASDEGAIPPLAFFGEAGTKIITIGSLAKTVWAGLRIGWVRAPLEIIEPLGRLKALADLGSPVLDQAIAVRFLPRIVEIARARHATIQGRLQHLQKLLTQHLPTWKWRPPDGGSALWIPLPDTNARIFAQIALRHGVEVVPGATMDPSGKHDNFIRIPCTFSEDVLATMVSRLSNAWRELRPSGARRERERSDG